jgi:hypothetical protein
VHKRRLPGHGPVVEQRREVELTGDLVRHETLRSFRKGEKLEQGNTAARSHATSSQNASTLTQLFGDGTRNHVPERAFCLSVQWRAGDPTTLVGVRPHVLLFADIAGARGMSAKGRPQKMV